MDETDTPMAEGHLAGQIAALAALSAELLIGLAATQAKLTLDETTSSQMGKMRGRLEKQFAAIGAQMRAAGMDDAAQGVADTMATVGGFIDAFPPNDNELGPEGRLWPGKPGN